jgi:AraC family transcriptional regulator
MGSRRVFTRPGDVLLSLPDRPTAFRIEDGRELTFVEIRPKHALRLIRLAGGLGMEDLAPLSAKPVRDPFVAELCRRLEEAEPGRAAASNWGLGLALASLLQHAAMLRAKRETRVQLPPLGLSEIIATIDREIESPLSVDALAAHAKLPRRVFARAFREATGLPTHQFILRRKADRAVHLLASTTLSLAEVAARSGFAHQAHMNRVLRGLKGATPGQLRLRATRYRFGSA